MSWWVSKLEHELESTHHESQDRAGEAMEARAAELLVVEQATAAEWGLDTVNVRQAETVVALQKSLAETEAAL